jgi:trimeric autotransporter adhesin
MNSLLKFLRRVRIHGGECGAVARALHHKAKFSSPAVFENVSSTTIERKQMTNKSISFKRVALALVAALGFGVTSAGTSQAYFSAATSTLTLSASTLSANLGDTVSVTGTVNFTSTHAEESLNVVLSTNISNVTEVFRGLTADSVNVRANSGVGGPANATDFFYVGPTNSNPESSGITAHTGGMFIPSSASGTTPTAVTAKFSIAFLVGTNATPGTYVQTITLRSVYNGVTTNLDVKTLTLTIAERDTTATAGKSLMWVHGSGTPGAAGSSLSTTAMGTPGNAAAISSDSAIVASAGTITTGAQTFANVGGIWWDPRNAADSNVAGILGSTSDVTGSLILNISGPGFLSKTGAYTTRLKSVTIDRTETAVIWSDGTAGTGTITGYIGSTALTQAAKTVTFFGKVATLTAYETTVVQMGAPSLSSNAADSVNVGNNIMYVQAKDSAGNTVKSAAMNTNANLWCISSDTSVASLTTTNTPTDAAKPSTAGFVAATAPGTGTFWTCNVRPLKEGSVTITLADDTVVATASITAAKTYTFAKSVGGTAAGFKGVGKITFDKTTYNVGEKAEITVTVLNASGNVPGAVLTTGDAAGTVFTSLTQNRPFSSVGKGTGNTDLGFGTNRTDLSFTTTGGTFFKGVETYVVYMPTTAGDVTITGFTTDGTYDTATAVSVTLKVVDPNAALIAASQAATVAAAEAATDAAAEAIDAANAATDAANLAAEAADAATVAAEEARDAADSATAAVEELATQVATLMAALKAQITTLANTVAKIAKKVKA